jgi:hypothetical protein
MVIVRSILTFRQNGLEPEPGKTDLSSSGLSWQGLLFLFSNTEDLPI